MARRKVKLVPIAMLPTTPGPSSLFRAKIPWGGLCRAMGLCLAWPCPLFLGCLVCPKSATTRCLGLAKLVPAFDAAHDPSTKSL